MNSTQLIPIALAIAAALACGAFTRAQDANSSWLLSAPQLSTRYRSSFSASHLDFTPLQSPASTSPSPNSVGSGAAAHPAQTPAPASEPTSTANYSRSDEHRFWDATNDWLFA